MYSYVDPRQQIRTVEYVADKNGFHPLLITNPTQDTRAVQNAKARHYILYNQIAADHQRVAIERGQTQEYDYDGNYDGSEDDSTFDPNLLISHPQDTPTVELAKLKHYDLYNKIALEHAKIAAERGDYEEQPQSSQEHIVKIGYTNS